MLIADRVPPANVEAEEAILGGILLDPGAIGRVLNLKPEAFSVSCHQKIFKACKSLADKGKPTDLMAVMTWLSDRKLLDAVGGANKLIQLMDRTVSAVNIDLYAELVAEKYYRRTIAELGEQLYERAHQAAIATSSVVKWVLEKVEELPSLAQEEALDTHRYRKCIAEVQEVELSITDPGLKAWKLKKLAVKYDCTPRQLEEIYYRSLLAEDDEPIMTWEEGIQKYGSAVREWHMHGWLPKGKLIIEHGDGGAGKTRLSYNFLYHVATGQDWDEFPVKQGRCLVVQTDESPSDMFQALEDRGLANNPNIRYKTRWNIDFLQGLVQEIEQFKPIFILIDSLTSINKRSIFSENDVEYARPLLLLKDIAQKYGITIIVIHHSSREGNARGSTAIRNSASEVWKLKVDNSRSIDGSHRVLEIEKSRSRKLASYLLRYNEEDGSWACLGKAGDTNEEGGVGGPAKERIVRFLKRSPGTFFHPEEIQNEIGGGIDHVRRSCSELAQEGIISRKGRRPTLYGINFGDKEPTAPPPEPSPLSTPLLGLDTTDRSVQAINSRSIGRSIPEPFSGKTSSEFRSTDRQNEKNFESDRQKNFAIWRSNDQLTSDEDAKRSPANDSNYVDTTDRLSTPSDRSPVEPAINCNESSHSDKETTNDERSPQLTDADVEDFAGLIRYAIAHPEAAEGVQESLSGYFSEHPSGKKKVWAALTKDERSAFKDLTANPMDGLGQEVKVGDRVASIHDDQKIGEIVRLEPSFRGSPKRPFIQWTAIVRWATCVEPEDEAVEFIQLIKDSSPPEKWRPKVNERCQKLNGSPLTIIEDRGHSFIILYDNGNEGRLHLQHLKPLPPDKDLKVIAQNLFEQIQPGDYLQALKHPDHKGFARRRGKVTAKRQLDGKYLEQCETERGIEIFNLEAVKVCSDTKQ